MNGHVSSPPPFQKLTSAYSKICIYLKNRIVRTRHTHILYENNFKTHIQYENNENKPQHSLDHGSSHYRRSKNMILHTSITIQYKTCRQDIKLALRNTWCTNISAVKYLINIMSYASGNWLKEVFQVQLAKCS
jgi:hypothetical protein